MVKEASRCLQFFHSLDPTITQDSLTKRVTKTAEGRITRQHHQKKSPRSDLESLQDSTAGLWLDCAPKSDMHKIANDEFHVALTLRLFLHQKCIIPGTMCECKKDKSAIPLDSKGGNSIHNHDRVKDQTAKILSYCGLSTKVEEQNAFRGYDEENGKRPDITIFNHPDHAGKFFLDVRISSPVPANSGPLTIPQAKKKFRAGNKAFSEKVNSYKHALDQRLGFFPIIFETTGGMHHETLPFFITCLEQASRVRQIPFTVL